MRNKVILVDKHNNAIGEMDKMQAHKEGVLHRAFSIFIFNRKGDMLLHQRAANKYHGAGLWTNACCSHPQFGEETKASALERLRYEMGLQCDLEEIFSFVYKAEVENQLVEHEHDHVFIGETDALPKPNPAEVQSYRWLSPVLLQQWMDDAPEEFTYWFRMAVGKVLEKQAA